MWQPPSQLRAVAACATTALQLPCCILSCIIIHQRPSDLVACCCYPSVPSCYLVYAFRGTLDISHQSLHSLPCICVRVRVLFMSYMIYANGAAMVTLLYCTCVCIGEPCLISLLVFLFKKPCVQVPPVVPSYRHTYCCIPTYTLGAFLSSTHVLQLIACAGLVWATCVPKLYVLHWATVANVGRGVPVRMGRAVATASACVSRLGGAPSSSRCCGPQSSCV